MSVTPIWTTSGEGDVSADYDPKTNTSTLSYEFSGRQVHSLQTWTYRNTQITPKDVVLDWDYTGFHAWYKAYIKICLVLVKKDGTSETRVLMEGEKRGNIAGNGQEVAALENCKEYYFQIQGINKDSDSRLLGTLKVKEVKDMEDVDGNPQWTTKGPGDVYADYHVGTDTSDLSYKLSGDDVHSLQTWTYTSSKGFSKNVVFDWDFNGFHAWYKAFIKISLVFVKKDGINDTKVLMEGEKRGTITGKGQVIASMSDCEEYYFEIQGKNFDSDRRLQGTLKVKETEDEDPEFKADGPGEVSATYKSENDTSDLSYKLTGEAVHSLQTWTYTSELIKNKDVLFNWDYTGFHAWYRAYIKISLVLVNKDGNTDKKVLMEGEKRGTITGKGQELVSMTGYKKYYFEVQGKNFDADMRLLGTLKVKET